MRNGWGRANRSVSNWDAIFLIDDETFRAYQAEVQDTVEAYEAREENFLLGIVGAVIGVIIGGAVALLVASWLCI